MMMRYAVGAAAAGILLASAVAQGAPSNRELEERANAMEARLQAVERASQALVQMQQQIEGGREELRRLQGQIDEARHELESLRKQQRDLYSDVDRRLLVIENDGGTTAPKTLQSPATESEIRAVDEATIYGDAFAALKAGRFDESVRGFQLYLTKYPQGPRADNAAYWLGESHYVAKDFESAQKAFQSVIDNYPDSRKAPDALLKVGYCQYEIKAYQYARTTLERVVTEYPGTEAARLAEARVTKMDVEGR
ncbi:MAG TPA: tol-pal system protein YbgF [Steroidobacteraceae bacterium]